MRKLILGTLCLAMAGTSSLFAGNYARIEDSGCQVTTLEELTNETVGDFFSGRTPQVIIECLQGTTLPFNLSLKGEFLALESEDTPRTIKILKSCYVKCVDDTFFFSSDLQNWKEFQEFFTGAVGVTLNLDEGIPTVGLNIDLNGRT